MFSRLSYTAEKTVLPLIAFTTQVVKFVTRIRYIHIYISILSSMTVCLFA